MIVFHYINIDELEQILATTSRGNQKLTLKAKHRCFLNDDHQHTFGNYLLPSCIDSIEDELGIDPQIAISELIKQKDYLKYILDTINTYNDHNQGMEFFVLSFSEDQDNIEMWRKNTNGGRGLALGFDTDMLRPEHSRFFNVISDKCTYWSDEIKKSDFRLTSDNNLYKSIRDTYKMMANPQVIESFNQIYKQDGPAAFVPQRIKDTLVSNIITTFDVFHKQDVCRNENEYRITLSPMPIDILFEKDINNDYIPFANVPFPVEALKMIMIGQKCGRNAYGMVKSMLLQKGISHDIKILNSTLQCL